MSLLIVHTIQGLRVIHNRGYCLDVKGGKKVKIMRLWSIGNPREELVKIVGIMEAHSWKSVPN